MLYRGWRSCGTCPFLSENEQNGFTNSCPVARSSSPDLPGSIWRFCNSSYSICVRPGNCHLFRAKKKRDSLDSRNIAFYWTLQPSTIYSFTAKEEQMVFISSVFINTYILLSGFTSLILIVVFVGLYGCQLFPEKILKIWVVPVDGEVWVGIWPRIYGIT